MKPALNRVIFLALILAACSTASASSDEVSSANEAVVKQAFSDWRRGDGSIFDLLAEDVIWTVAGISPMSGTYEGKQTVVDDLLPPILDRLATPITPEVQHVIAKENDVVVIWRGTAETKAGERYDNTYAWHLTMQDGKIQRVNAFLDTWALQELLETS